MRTSMKIALVALGLWTGGAAYITQIMRPGPPAQDVQTVLKRAADIYGLDPAFLSAVAWQESRHGALGCSKAGACGVLQLMPATAGDIDVDNPVANIMVGAEFLAKLLAKHHGNRGLALASYNWGPTNVDRWLQKGARVSKLPKETQDYVQAITGKPIAAWLAAPASVPLPVPRPTV